MKIARFIARDIEKRKIVGAPFNNKYHGPHVNLRKPKVHIARTRNDYLPHFKKHLAEHRKISGFVGVGRPVEMMDENGFTHGRNKPSGI